MRAEDEAQFCRRRKMKEAPVESGGSFALVK
jgi:hypothetical protein